MENKITIKDNYLKIKLFGSTTLEQRLLQISNIMSIVSKTRSRYLLVEMNPESSLTSIEDL